MYREGGYAGGGGFVWGGICGNLLVMVAIGMTIGWAWKKISELRSTEI